jgi:hypothetical protein
MVWLMLFPAASVAVTLMLREPSVCAEAGRV